VSSFSRSLIGLFSFSGLLLSFSLMILVLVVLSSDFRDCFHISFDSLEKILHLLWCF